LYHGFQSDATTLDKGDGQRYNLAVISSGDITHAVRIYT
jgi:hypothetical protein